MSDRSRNLLCAIKDEIASQPGGTCDDPVHVVACDPPDAETPGTPECVKWSSVFVQLDNTGTRFDESHEITVTNSDGSETVLTIAPQAGWSQQITEWAAQLDAAYTGTFDARCTTGCGGLLPPPSDSPPQKGIIARYVQGVFCPTDRAIPVSATITDSSNPARVGRKLIMYVVEGPEYRGQICRTCDEGAGELQFEDGTAVPEADLPVCTFSCAEAIPATPLAACEFDAFESGCDNVNSETQADWVSITRIVSICEGVISVDYYTADPADPTALIEYSLVGEYVDCATGEPVPEPAEECDVATVELCEDPCKNGSTYINGRPPASNAWTWGPYSAPNLTDFETALEAAGYTVHRAGEKHQICPPFGAFGEDPDAVLDNGIGDPAAVPVEPNIDPEFVSEDKCALVTAGKNDDRRDAKLDEITDLLSQLVECLCGPCDEGVALNRACQSYSHPLTSGYRNWSDAGDLGDLASEFGITPTAPEMWVRITEFDCGGTAQPQVGQIFGPYTPGPSGSDGFIADLEAAVAGTCLVPSVGPGSGPSGIGSNLNYSYDSTQDATLVIQEGVSVGAGVGWFTSAQGFTVRSGVAGDFISSSGNGVTTSYASDAVGDLPSYVDAQDCVDL